MVTADKIETPEEMRLRIESEREEALRAFAEKWDKQHAREMEKAEEEAAKKAMEGKLLDFTTAVRDTVIDAIPVLGIIVPEKGLKFEMVITRASDGSPMFTLTQPEGKARATSTGGARAPRGSGSGGKSVTQIAGLTGFILADGTETKTASAVAKEAGIFRDGDNQGRVVAAWAIKDRDAANKVKAVVNDTAVPLGDLVAQTWPATTPATPAEETPAEVPAEA